MLFQMMFSCNLLLLCIQFMVKLDIFHILFCLLINFITHICDKFCSLLLMNQTKQIKNTLFIHGETVNFEHVKHIDKTQIFNIIATEAKIVKKECFHDWYSIRYAYFPKLEVVEYRGFYGCYALYHV